MFEKLISSIYLFIKTFVTLVGIIQSNLEFYKMMDFNIFNKIETQKNPFLSILHTIGKFFSESDNGKSAFLFFLITCVIFTNLFSTISAVVLGIFYIIFCIYFKWDLCYLMISIIFLIVIVELIFNFFNRKKKK